jgi:hypothetical protein
MAKLEKIIFRETTTLGIRRWLARRHKLDRRPHTVQTPHGPIEGKLASFPEGGSSFAPEYESCRRAAEATGLPLKDIYEAARTAYDPAKPGEE